MSRLVAATADIKPRPTSVIPLSHRKTQKGRGDTDADLDADSDADANLVADADAGFDANEQEILIVET